MSYSEYPFTVKNKQAYTFGKLFKTEQKIGGITSVRKFHNPVLTNQISQSNYSNLAKQEKDQDIIETLSQVSSQYKAKSKIGRPQSASHKFKNYNPSTVEQNVDGLKAFLPVEYFKHTGYISKGT